MNNYSLDEVIVRCPYCGESIKPWIDYSAGPQQYYEDCTVCCAPILFELQEAGMDGQLRVAVWRDDD